MMVRHAGLAAALVGAAACVHSNVLVLDPARRPQTHADSIRLLAQEPQQPYTVIGLVSAWVELGSVDDARRRLQKEAARLGGDALLFEAESLATSRKGGPQLSAKVIVFDRRPAPDPPPRRHLR